MFEGVSKWILAALWLGAVSAEAAPPGNDDFQAAYVMTGLPAVAAGGNQEATRQPGEPNDADGHGRASLWWRWTAPATGWMEVNTLESDYDTTLSVYSGSGLNGLTLLKYSDDALKTKQSRVRFSAVAGTEYHIQVQSWFQAAGTARLRIQAASAPQPPTLQKVTLTPDSFVSKNLFDGVIVSVVTEITAPDGLGGAVLFMQGPQGQWGEMTDLLRLEPEPVPEKPFSEVWESQFHIAHVYPGNGKSAFLGDWRIRVVLTDDFGESFGFGGPGEPPLPGESPPVLKISGSDDVEGAVVTSVKVTPNVVDVTDHPQAVTLEMTARDDVSVNYLEVHLRNPQGHSVAYGFSDGPVSGTPENGVWRLAMDIPAHLSAGSYVFDCFATDTVMRGQPTTAPIIERTLTVVNSGMTDSVAPDIRAVSISPSRISVEDLPAEVQVRIEVSDMKGVESAWMNFRVANLSGGEVHDSYLRKVSRTGDTEVWESTIAIAKGALPGLYPIQYSLMDRAGNRTFITNDDRRFAWGTKTPVPPGIPAVFTITPGTTDAFSVWRAKYAQLAGPQGEFDVDADADGFINAVEFLCGTDPLLASGPGKPDLNGERIPFFSSTPTGLRLEYRLSTENISLGEGTYWQIRPRILQPSSGVTAWHTSFSKHVTKDLFRAELPIDGANRFMKLILNTEFLKTIPYPP